MAKMPSWRMMMVGVLCGVLSLAAWGIGPASADMFKIDGLDVDEQGADAVTARQAAIANAERRGLRLLLQRLTASADHGRLPDTSRLNASQFVRSVDIASEKLSPTRYIATVNVAYQSEPVLNLLRQAAIAHVTQPRPDILVVPAVRDAGGLRLAQRGETWQAIWRRISVMGGMVGWQTIEGSNADQAELITSGGAVGSPAFATMKDRYNADQVMLAVLESETTGLRYSLTGVHGLGLDRTGLLTATEVGGQAVALKRVLDEATNSLGAQWKARNLVRADQVSQLLINVEIADFAEWVTINNQLTRLALTRDVAVQEFSRSHAKLALDYVGDRADLDAALRARGLVLQLEEQTWQLRRAGSL